MSAIVKTVITSQQDVEISLTQNLDKDTTKKQSTDRKISEMHRDSKRQNPIEKARTYKVLKKKAQKKEPLQKINITKDKKVKIAKLEFSIYNFRQDD